MENIKINKLPAPTYRHLKMNFAEVAEADYSAIEPEIEVPEGISLEKTGGALDIETGCGEEITALLDKLGVYTLSAAKAVSEPARAEIKLKEGEAQAVRIELKAAAGAELTAVEFIESDENSSGRAAVQTVMRAAEGAKLHLIQIIRVGSGFELINDIGADEGDRAYIEITQLYLGGGRVYGGLTDKLGGYMSELRNDIGYLLKNEEKLDINILASHMGKKSNCEINARGVLSDRSSKIFRGTIDFINGASGSKGAENEEVLLMNEEVVNKTVPLILCAEEDVEGSHGASIGRLNEEFIFYMMSRGLSLERIYEIMANAKIETVMRRIDDKAALDRIYGYIGGGSEDDGE